MLKNFSDTVKFRHPAGDYGGRHSRASLFAPQERAGDMENSYIEDADARSEMTEFSVAGEERASHGSIKEMLAQTSLVDLGKQLTSAQMND